MRIEGELKRAEKQREEVPETPEKESSSPAPSEPAPPRQDEQGLVVEGLSNCLVKFARCCTPVPGDKITGFVTHGYGVSVHRADCPNASEQRREQTPGRWVNVSWGTEHDELYPAALEAVCKSRDTLNKEIMNAISESGIRLRTIHIESPDDNFTTCHLEVRIHDLKELQALMRKIHQISGVLSVSRPAG